MVSLESSVALEDTDDDLTLGETWPAVVMILPPLHVDTLIGRSWSRSLGIANAKRSEG
jgi:hypothetical protein